MLTRHNILDYVLAKYNTLPEKPWQRNPDYIVLRHQRHRKWYGVIMNVSKQRLQLDDQGQVDIINIKIDPELNIFLNGKRGILPAYHMNKKHWISIILDNSLPDDEIKNFIHMSYDLTR